MRILRELEKRPCKNQRPRKDVRVQDCGLVLVREHDASSIEALVVRMKYVFSDLDALDTGRVRCDRLLAAVKATDGSFAKIVGAEVQNKIVQLVENFTYVLSNSVPSRLLISQEEFLEIVEAVLRNRDPANAAKGSVFYRATYRTIVTVRRIEEEKRPSIFGILSNEEMRIIADLFDTLVVESKASSDVEMKTADGLNAADGLVDVASLASVLGDSLSLPIGDFQDGPSMNLEEIYGYFNACKTSDSESFDSFVAKRRERETSSPPSKEPDDAANGSFTDSK